MKTTLGLACLLSAGVALAAPPPSTPPPAAPAEPAPAASKPAPLPPIQLPAGLATGWYAWIETALGPILVHLLPDQAPQSVAWFAGLANGTIGWPDPISGELRKEPYYDGVQVTKAVAADRFEVGEHLDVGRFMPPFFVPAEVAGPVDYSRPGRLGRIRSSLDRTSAVKFFLTAGTMPYLNGLQPCFGEVVSGQDLVLRISESKADGRGMPLEPVLIRRIRVLKVGDPPPLAEPVPYTPKPVRFGMRPEAATTEPR